jgi:hypothetical protein
LTVVSTFNRSTGFGPSARIQDLAETLRFSTAAAQLSAPLVTAASGRPPSPP